MVRMGGVQPAALEVVKAAIGRNENGGSFTEQGDGDAVPEQSYEDMLNFNWKDIADASLHSREQRSLEEDSRKPINILLNFLISMYNYVALVLWPSMEFKILLGEPIFSNYYFVVFIFIFYKRLSPMQLILIISLQFRVNPLYVALLVVFFRQYSHRAEKPKQFKPMNKKDLNVAISAASKIPPAARRFGMTSSETAIDLQAVCTSINNDAYDHILVGADLSTLYVAALLSKCGHRCCILRLKAGPQLKITLPSFSLPICVLDPCVSKLTQYQSMLDVAVPRSAPAQRTFLRRAGSAEWGYVHTTVSCSIAQAASNVDFSFRAGQTSLAEDIGADFNVEATVVSRLLSPMAFISDLVSVYLATKVSTYPLKSESLTAAGKAIMGHVTSYSALAAMSAKTFFSNFVNKEENKRFATPLELVQSVLSAVSGWTLRDPSSVSMLHIGAAFGPMAHHGCYIPENGVDGLYTMLCTAITEAGGRICAEIEQIEGFVVEEVPTDSTQASQNMPQTYHGSDNSRETKRTRLLGVMVRDNSKVMIVKPRLSVVSGLGVISTYRNVMLATIKPSPGNGDQEISFAHVVPTEVEKVWRGVEEAAATVLCVFAVSKRCLDTADGSILAAMSCAHFKSSLFDETIKYDATGNLLHVQADLKNGLVVDGRYKVWSPSLSDSNRNEKDCDQIIFIVELLAGNELATPEASDGPTTYQAVNGSVNVDSIRRMGEYAVINAVYTAKLRLISHAILSRVHPTILPQHINSFSAVLSPIGGHMLAGMPSKYAAGFKSKTVFENLYLCGCDVGTFGFAGEIQGGWVAANAVLGYNIGDLISQRSVTTDLRRVL